MNRRRFLAASLLLPLAGRTLLHAGDACAVHGAPAGLTWDWVTEEADRQRMFLIGDWGTRGSLQKRVAAAMEKVAAERGDISHVISTGDNIYPSGVESADDPLWASTFENVYTGPHLQVPWIAVLGNHDYRKRFMAQVEYGKINPRWVMPAPYFARRIKGAGELGTSVICLDTQQLLQKTDGWKDQLSWLEAELPKHTDSTWILVIGHHPIRSYGHYGNNAWLLSNVRPLLNQGRVDAYICGHDHDQQLIKYPDDTFHCLVTGGGGGCRSTAWGEHTIAAATNGGFAKWSASRNNAHLSLINAEGNPVGNVALRPQQRT